MIFGSLLLLNHTCYHYHTYVLNSCICPTCPLSFSGSKVKVKVTKAFLISTSIPLLFKAMDFICLFVRYTIFSQTAHPIFLKLSHIHKVDLTQNPIHLLLSRSKVKVKVTERSKITFLTITLSIMVRFTRNQRHIFP